MLLRQNFVTVDLGAIRNNFRVLSDSLTAKTKVMPVVKADAYGHGLLQVARAVTLEGATCLAVALVEEGAKLRENGIETDILVMGAATERAAAEAVRLRLTQTVFEPRMVHVLDCVAREQGKTAGVHIKLDTGMGRIGLQTEEEARILTEALSNAKHVRVEGIYTHFSDADNPGKDGKMNDFSRKQLERFLRLKAFFSDDIPAHAANSAMSLLAPEAGFQMVREGISLYGYPPVATNLAFRRALTWETEVVHVKEVKKGETIGYGRTYTAPRNMRVATVAVGYGDGYHRLCGNRAQMLVGGARANVVGRVCMDQTMIDITEIKGVCVGDPVMLVGRQGNEEITAEELALWADTISYEVLLSITGRVPRFYTNQ